MATATVEKKRTFDNAFKLKVIIDYASQYTNIAAAWCMELIRTYV